MDCNTSVGIEQFILLLKTKDMRQLKEKRKVVMLPTEKASRIKFIPKGELFYEEGLCAFSKLKEDTLMFLPKATEYGYPSHHLYIISNKEIKEGDWTIYSSIATNGQQRVLQNVFGVLGSVIGTPAFIKQNCFKIEASTDKSLGLPLIPEGFVRKYCESPIEEVMVDTINCITTCHECKHVMYYDAMRCDKCNEELLDSNTKYVNKVKTDKNNYITITKVKDSYTKEEIKKLFNEFMKEDFIDFHKEAGITAWDKFDQWIDKNL
jgi:hypothetical protein